MDTRNDLSRATAGRWLAVGRAGLALLLAGLAVVAEGTFRWPAGLWIAASAAFALAGVGFLFPGSSRLRTGLLAADLAWIGLAVAAAGRADAGLTLLYTLVAFAAGFTVGGRTAMALGTAAACSLALVGGAVGLDQEPSFLAAQSLLVLVLGLVAVRLRERIDQGERALATASMALERLRLDTDVIVQNLTSGLVTVDASGAVVHLNRVARDTLGLADDAAGRPVREALGPGAEALAVEVENGLSGGDPVRRREVTVRRGDDLVPLGLGTTILRAADGGILGVTVLFQDLTEIRRQEGEARRRDRLAAVGELAAGIAHEIRNSILPVSGSVQLLTQEIETNEEQAKLFEMILRETENIERFVGSLLNYTSTRPLRTETLDLAALVREAAEETRLRGEGAATVRVEGAEAPARVDAEQIRQVVRNLLGNALDAAGPGGAVRLRTGVDAAGEAWIEVEDDGPGIPEGDRARVFQPFVTQKPGGTGLGLPIAARIVEDHGGRIALDAASGGGARFRVTLPGASMPAAAAA